MLGNNPMGSRRRRRFYHRAGVVPIVNEISKVDFSDSNYYSYEMEPFDYSDEEEIKPSARFTQENGRRVNFITVSSLHSRLCDIIDSMIALAEEEDRENEKDKGSEKGIVKEDDVSVKEDDASNVNIAQVTAQEPAQKAGPSGIPSFNKAEKE